jgi:hypothetical protein
MRYFARGDSRRRQRDPDSQRMQDSQHLADLAGFLALFEVDDKAQTSAGGQRQILLRDTQPLPAFADHLANFLYGVFHWLTMTIPVRE